MALILSPALWVKQANLILAGLSLYRRALDDLAENSRLRTLAPRAGVDFTSNDYLGLAASYRLRTALETALARGTPAGAGGSRLLRGNAPEHEELEAAAAAFFHSERVLYFGGGYVANHAVLSTLPQKEDLIVLDALAHASAQEGARAGRAEVARARHNDSGAFEAQILEWRARGGRGRVWIVVESLYSMDGDRAPLDELMALADRLDTMLFVDEAHATGVYGPDGRGLTAALEGRENVLVLHTCGKALGSSGALVSGPRALCDFLINRCRPFIYATAPSPLMAVAALEALKILKDEPERRLRLAHLVALAGEAARAQGVPVSGSQILPVIIGADSSAVALASALQTRGFDVRAVRPPSVPEGTARLRISLTLNADAAAIVGLFDALAAERRTLAA
jgi:8-amino-7-oxononanoate synthase